MLLPFVLQAQITPNAGNTDATVVVPYQVVAAGPHHRVWQTVSVDEQGQTNVSSFTELATGLNYLNPATGQYEESKEQFQIAKDGSAIATNGQHQVILAADINSGGSVDLLTPDGQRLRSNPMGLVFFDTASGKSVLIAEVTNCVGQLVAPNVVLYPNAFDTLKAGIRYENTKMGFSQDIVLYQNPGSPADYGFDPATTDLEIWTEFFNPPTPQTTTDSSGDQTLDFGQMRVGHGLAYALSNQKLASVNVSKIWTLVNGRQFLIESVPFAQVEAQWESLQASVSRERKSSVALRTVRSRENLVALRGMERKEKSKEVASIRPGRADSRSGFVMDYSTLNTSQTNYLFLGDTTYFISGNVSLYGTTTFEGGTVIKYTNSVGLTANNAVAWLGSAYRPVVMTAKDDNSVGETITGSTGSPTGANYANPALQINSGNTQLHDLRVAYAQTGIYYYDYSAGNTINGVSHAQFVHCNQAMKVNGYGTSFQNFFVRNALFNDCSTAFYGYSFSGDIEHLTLNQCGQVANDYNGTNYNTTSSLALTNSLVVSITNGWGNVAITTNHTYNASSSAFQSVGEGAHYLTDNTYRNLGTSTINSTLASDLKNKTTYPPLVLTNDFTANTTLSPQAGRDTDTPDIGFHYDPLDYCWSGLNLTNSATLTLTNGVAIGCYGIKGTIMRNSGKFVSEGTPVNLNRLVRYQMVQEQPVLWGGTSSTMTLIYNSTTLPSVTLRFTDVSIMADTASRRNLYDSASYGANPLAITYSQLRGVSESFGDQTPTGTIVVFTNNLMERCTFRWSQSDYYSPFTLYLYNNLFHNGTSSFTTTSNNPAWTVKDNLFDCDSVTKSGPKTFSYSNNGYRSGLTSLGGSGNKTGLVPDYRTGPLGNFYYPTNGSSTSLTNLFDAGSRNATNAGLYHFTVRIDLAKETNSTVDIGNHYVATDANGNPIDNDGDGIPDYLEDRNGNGSVDSGETDWQSATDLGLKVWITEPKNNSNIP